MLKEGGGGGGGGGGGEEREFNLLLNQPRKLTLYQIPSFQDSTPRGVIRLLPSSWSRAVPQGSERMVDAVANASEQKKGIVTVVREWEEEEGGRGGGGGGRHRVPIMVVRSSIL